MKQPKPETATVIYKGNNRTNRPLSVMKRVIQTCLVWPSGMGLGW